MVLKKYGVAVKTYANRAADRIVAPWLDQGALTQSGKYRALDYDGICLPGETLQPSMFCDGGGDVLGLVVFGLCVVV